MISQVGLKFTAAIFAILSFASSIAAAPAEAEGSKTETYGRILVTTPDEILNPTLKASLRFSARLMKAARQIMASQRAAQQRELKYLKATGAVRVKVIFEDQWNTGALKLLNYKDKNTFRNWHLVGYSNTGKTIGRSQTFPVEKNNYANYLTRPVLLDCSVLDFQFWNLDTWFRTDQCQVTSPAAEAFLRAALGSYLVKSNNDLGSWELTKLAFALEPGHRITISSGALLCRDLAKEFGETSRIPLSRKQSQGGYEFSVNLNLRTAKFTFIAPDQQMMVDKAHKVAGQPWIDFGS